MIAAVALLTGCDPATRTQAEVAATPTATAAGAAIPSPTAVPSDTPVPSSTTTPEPIPTETTAPLPSPTATEAPTEAPTDTPAATLTPKPAKPSPTAAQLEPTETTEAAVATPTGDETPTSSGEGAPDLSRTVDGKFYDVYIDAATKTKQYYHYTCEFDAAWVVLKTNGIEATLQDQIDIVGLDTSIEPRFEETEEGVFIYGGDIFNHYSGDYKENFMARSTGRVMRKVFEHYGLSVEAVNSRDSLIAALHRGELVWIKTTADFKPGRPAKWVLPDGQTYDTVLGNDHAAVVMGYSERGALIRDVLGPTSTNWNREYEYEVPWPKFMAAWEQQQYDGLGVKK